MSPALRTIERRRLPEWQRLHARHEQLRILQLDLSRIILAMETRRPPTLLKANGSAQCPTEVPRHMKAVCLMLHGRKALRRGKWAKQWQAPRGRRRGK
jgi:hypothetical protein